MSKLEDARKAAAAKAREQARRDKAKLNARLLDLIGKHNEPFLDVVVDADAALNGTDFESDALREQAEQMWGDRIKAFAVQRDASAHVHATPGQNHGQQL